MHCLFAYLGYVKCLPLPGKIRGSLLTSKSVIHLECHLTFIDDIPLFLIVCVLCQLIGGCVVVFIKFRLCICLDFV